MKKYLLLLFTAISFAQTNPTKNQYGFYAGTATMNGSAIGQFDSTTKGFLFPRMTTTQRNGIVSPATSLVIFNTTTNAYNYYDGITWVVLGSNVDPLELNNTEKTVWNNGSGNISTNTSFGDQSLKSNTTGINNTSYGYKAMESNSSGQNNTAIGSNALRSMIGTLFNNTAVGNRALEVNDTGSFNTGVGHLALNSNTSGFANTAIGTNAIGNNTTGTYNTAVGGSALAGYSLGSNNSAVGYGALGTGVNNNSVAIGFEAGISKIGGTQITSSTGSIFIGRSTKALDHAQTNEIVIGDLAEGLGTNTTVLGNTSTTITRLRGAVRGGSFVKDSGTSSQVLMADGSVATAGTNITISAGTISASGGGGSGTVTNVTGTSPIVITGTSTITPNVTVNNAVADNTTFGVSTYLPADFNSSAGAISLDYTNGQSADTSTKGYLNSTDWNTFNGKQDVLVSGTNIKTINGTTILGSGDISTTQTTITGNAGTATALQTPRTINGTSFDGTADITVTAAAGTLTGSTLNSGVTASSLTSLGTLTSLAVTGTSSSGISVPIIFSGGTGTSAGGWKIGGLDANNGVMYSKAIVTPSSSNFAIMANSTKTEMNASTTLNMNVGGSVISSFTGAGMTMTSAKSITLGAGSTAIVPLKFVSGTNATTPQNGAVEYDGTNYFVTSGGVRYLLTRTLTGTAAPATTPAAVGIEYIDTVNAKVYKATGTTSSADWTILN